MPEPRNAQSCHGTRSIDSRVSAKRSQGASGRAGRCPEKKLRADFEHHREAANAGWHGVHKAAAVPPRGKKWHHYWMVVPPVRFPQNSFDDPSFLAAIQKARPGVNVPMTGRSQSWFLQSLQYSPPVHLFVLKLDLHLQHPTKEVT